MVKYSCERCGKEFSQKSHYDSQKRRKTPCENNADKIKTLVDKEVEEFTNATNLNFINNHGVDVYNDIEGLAALIEICDLIITIPNVTVQLSGALGKKGWVIVPFSPNFTWTIDKARSLWYPNINIYRQKKINDWTEVLIELESEALKLSGYFK